jgi:CO/xanthine dehydrogenase Mo-binding subunit
MKSRPPLKVAGTSPPRLDGAEKVTGAALYTGDMDLPGMGHAKILRSPAAHAKIARIDARRAESLPGVIAVLTRDDLAPLKFKFGAIHKDQSIVATDKARYAGDPVAAVLAVDEMTAEEALALIEVEYEDLPALTTIEEALADGAPLVHEQWFGQAELRGSSYGASDKFKGTNVCSQFGYSRGDTQKAFEKSAHVFEDVFRFPKVQHYSLEPHVMIAHFERDHLTVWSSCQDPFGLRDHLAAIFNLPLSRVRIIVPYVGGGYGGKLYVKAEPIAAALSWKARRPVKLVMSAGDSFKTVTRHPARVRIKSGVAQDGRLLARRLRRRRSARHAKGRLSRARTVSHSQRQGRRLLRL